MNLAMKWKSGCVFSVLIMCSKAPLAEAVEKCLDDTVINCVCYSLFKNATIHGSSFPSHFLLIKAIFKRLPNR